MTVFENAGRAFLPPRRRFNHERQSGSAGERILQERLGTAERARQFYQNQVTSQLTLAMRQFIQRMEMAFVASSDGAGECDCTFRAGPPGFIKVIDDRTIAYPEYRGNGVMASLGNMLQNPHVGILLVDFTDDLIGLHVNGEASIVSPARMGEFDLEINETTRGGRRPVQWVVLRVTEAYVHCSKHIPKLVPQSRVRHWGTDNPRHKGGDYFGVAASPQQREARDRYLGGRQPPPAVVRAHPGEPDPRPGAWRACPAPDARMAGMRVEVTLDCADLDAAAAFWQAALGYARGHVIEGRYVTLSGNGPALSLQRVPEPKAGKNRLHLDLLVADVEGQVARLQALGATVLPPGAREEFGQRWFVLADPEGNEFCVAELPPAC